MLNDIIKYNYSFQGKSHVSKGTECQDSSQIVKLCDNYYLAVVADGVGSAKRSQIGAKIATTSVIDFFVKNFTRRKNKDVVKDMFKLSFNIAIENISIESEKNKEPLSYYDTTLSAVLYDGRRIIYAHCGDGAIIGLTSFGEYVEVSTVQKGDDLVSVVPLRGGPESWEINYYDEDLNSVMLLTDGMFETMCPPLLKKRSKNNVYIPLGAFFADPYGFSKRNPVEDLKEIESFIRFDSNYNPNRFYNRLAHIYSKHAPADYSHIIESQIQKNHYPLKFMGGQQDDKTVACLINRTATFEKQPIEYYYEPDWESLNQQMNHRLYPSMIQPQREVVPESTQLENRIINNNSIEDIDNQEQKTLDKILSFLKLKRPKN